MRPGFAYRGALLALAIIGSGCDRTSRAPRLTAADESPAVFGVLQVPRTPGPHPAVVLLPGSGGWRPAYARFARAFADSGFVALALDYYAKAGRGRTQAEEMQHWPAWQATIRNAVRWLEKSQVVAGKPIALVGYSRGAMLAISVGDSALPTAAIVDYYGSGSDDDPADERMATFPPLLILHGEADSNIPVALAHRLFDRLHRKGADVEMYIYPGVEHGFNTPWSPGYSAHADADAWRRTIRFLRQKLNP